MFGLENIAFGLRSQLFTACQLCHVCVVQSSGFPVELYLAFFLICYLTDNCLKSQTKDLLGLQSLKGLSNEKLWLLREVMELLDITWITFIFITLCPSYLGKWIPPFYNYENKIYIFYTAPVKHITKNREYIE